MNAPNDIIDREDSSNLGSAGGGGIAATGVTTPRIPTNVSTHIDLFAIKSSIAPPYHDHDQKIGSKNWEELGSEWIYLKRHPGGAVEDIYIVRMMPLERHAYFSGGKQLLG
jgi:hypothetical protein